MHYRLIATPSLRGGGPVLPQSSVSLESSSNQTSEMCPSQWRLGSGASSAGFPGGYTLQIVDQGGNEALSSISKTSQGLPTTNIAVIDYSAISTYSDLFLSCQSPGGDSFDLHYQPTD